VQATRRATGFDPIRFEVVRNAFVFATEEMAATLRRSAYSTNVKTRADFSCGLFDRELRTIAQSFNQPAHLGTLSRLVPQVVREYGVENLGPGDGLLCNDPYRGGAHLNDITLISPIHYRGELFGYVANLAHHVDVGGGAPASIGAFQEIYQEGIQIPGVKLVQAGEIVPDIFKLIMAQVRAKRETTGDFRAQVAANHTGVLRVCELVERLGAESVVEYVDELLAYTERRTRAEIAQLPRGTCSAVGFLDDDGLTDVPVRLQVRVDITDEGVHFDLSGSDPERRAPVNSAYSQTYAACAFALKCLTDPDVPVNAGFYRVLSINAPSGTVVNCAHPAPVVGGWETAIRLVDVIFLALSQLIPERVAAGCKAMICHTGFGGIDPRSGEYYCYLETVAGGFGGRHGKDGPDAVQGHTQNTENAPIEETEYAYPIRFVRYGLVADSDGPGQWRGGLGVLRDYLFVDHDASFTILADRAKQAPWGLFGGLPGKLAEYILNPDEEARHLGTKMTIQLKAGDIVSYRTCGGGGYGPPFERDPALVVQDVRNEKVSLDRARELYGVAVDPATWTFDPVETARLRASTRPETSS
jgi:N-methylhydantoinase B